MNTHRVVYLHGFASSPHSSKARFFAGRFEQAGVEFLAPALDGGDFERLTITSQLRIVEDAVGTGPVVLMGSSLGGYLAALFATRHPEKVERLILLAPAFGFLQRFRGRLTPEQLAHWKQNGKLMLYHYGAKSEQALGYQLIEDAERYESAPAFPQPGLILHGTADEVVPAAGSQAFQKAHANAKFRLVDSGHELTDVLEELWSETAAFLRPIHQG